MSHPHLSKTPLAEQGLIKPEAAFTLEQSEKMLEEFIRKLAPLVIDKKKE